MKKLILALCLFLFIIMSSHKSALVGLWQSQNGVVLSFSATHISSNDKNLLYRFLSENTLVIFENSRPHKIDYILSFDKNSLTIFGEEFNRAH